MDHQELALLVLGALLHDIGKFAQRAGAPKSREMEENIVQRATDTPPIPMSFTQTIS